MNAIRNYLDNMFRNLPNTEEVRRAKSELLQMMEDKYEELISEGKTENEAVGIVISEFGNLDELADSLGISEAVTENPTEDKPMLSLDRVKEYISMISTKSILTPLGIALCILSVVSPILADVLPVDIDIVGAGGMFGIIAIAVGLFIFSGIRSKEYAEVKNKECSLSIEGAEYVRNERKSFKHSYGLMSSFGIGLCILSIINPIVIDKIPYVNSNFGAAMMFVFVALGVFLITSANTKMNGYDRLLELNESGRMSEEFVPKAERKVNKAPIIICSIIAIAVVAFSASVRFFIPFFTGVFIKDDIIDTVATTYELTDGDTADMNAQGEVKSIKLDLKACSVNFEITDGNGLVGVEYSGDKRLKPEITFENGKLVATQKNIQSFSLRSYNGPKLTIKLGADVSLENLEMNINAGDIDMKNIHADYFYGDFDAGNIIIKNSVFAKADLEADAGNIQINDSDIKILKIQTDAGNIEIKDTDLEKVDISSDFGNVVIKGLDNIEDYDIECHVDAGAIQVENHVSGRSYESRGTGAGSIKVDVDAGNIEIK
jgi:cytochrome c-type biogenesis protein CcmE